MFDSQDRHQTVMFEERPWGEFHVLEDADTHKVKRIMVTPGKRLSYQQHKKRSEHWVVIRGTARVTLDGFLHTLEKGHAIDIPQESWHRIENAGEDLLVFIEVQLGDYFGEDDIIRADDDYGRHDEIEAHLLHEHALAESHHTKVDS